MLFVIEYSKEEETKCLTQEKGSAVTTRGAQNMYKLWSNLRTLTKQFKTQGLKTEQEVVLLRSLSVASLVKQIMGRC